MIVVFVVFPLLWMVFFPIGVFIYAIELPLRLFVFSDKHSSLLLYRKIDDKYKPIEVEFIKCEDGKRDGDDILFVHGWPDKGLMWDKQVR